ncbi:MAG: hypothetical protein EA404_01645 [Spirochaetaceae bacterium]|nr:MAG: hypothetical protein EA404_01645 [Spirochaetaceae bacterium]
MVIVVGQNSAWQKTYRFGRICRGEVNRVLEVRESAAGKGANACRVLVRYAVAAELHAYIGGANGRKFAQACAADGLQTQFTEIEGETRICTTLIEEDSTMTEIVEPAPPVTPAERERAHALLFDRLSEASMLAICGTAMAGETEECYREFVAAARRAGVPVVLDSYRTHGKLALEAAPQMLKINRDELAELAAMPVSSAAERIAAYRELSTRYGLHWIVITHGKDGAEGFNGHAVVRVQPPQVTVVNPIGSGDSATAGIIVAVERANGSFAETWSDIDNLRAAVVEVVTTGTANCMNHKPGHVEQSDLDWVRENCSVKIEELD